jgi:hypothetical protein
MASNPWVIDTTIPNGQVLFDGEMHNAQVEYVEYTDPSHFVEVQDRLGNIVARLRGALDFRTVRTGKVGWLHGFTVPQFDKDGNNNMASGRLIAYFE